MSQRITVARDFSRFPAGRYRADGPFSGEQFRQQVLVPSLRSGSDPVIVDLSGTLGYGSSFLEEAFGGLVRAEGFSVQALRSRLRLEAKDESLVDEIWGYIDGANVAARQ